MYTQYVIILFISGNTPIKIGIYNVSIRFLSTYSRVPPPFSRTEQLLRAELHCTRR